MKIVVVKTKSGDVYFRFSSIKSCDKAVALASELVYDNNFDIPPEDRKAAKSAIRTHDVQSLIRLLERCNALRVVEVL